MATRKQATPPVDEDPIEDDDLDAVLEQAQLDADEVEIDLSEAVDFEALPDGRYLAEIIECKAGPGIVTKGSSKSPSVPKAVFRFRILPNPETGDKTGAKRQLFKHPPLKGKGAGIAKQILKAVGIELDLERPKFSPKRTEGSLLWLDLVVQKDDSRYNEITGYAPYDGDKPEIDFDDEIETYDDEDEV